MHRLVWIPLALALGLVTLQAAARGLDAARVDSSADTGADTGGDSGAGSGPDSGQDTGGEALCTLEAGADDATGAPTMVVSCSAAAAGALDSVLAAAPSAHLCVVDGASQQLSCVIPSAYPGSYAALCKQHEGAVRCTVPYVASPPAASSTCAALAQSLGLDPSVSAPSGAWCNNLQPGSCLCVPASALGLGSGSYAAQSGGACNAIPSPPGASPLLGYTPRTPATGAQTLREQVEACVDDASCAPGELPTWGGSVPAIGMIQGGVAGVYTLTLGQAPSCRAVRDGGFVDKVDLKKEDAPYERPSR